MGYGATILVMEDDAAKRRRFVDALVEQGYAVSEVGTIADAKKQIENSAFDICLCSMRITDEIATALCEQFSQLAEMGTHMVLVSENNRYHNLCAEVGFRHFVPDTTSLDELTGIIDRLSASLTTPNLIN